MRKKLPRLLPRLHWRKVMSPPNLRRGILAILGARPAPLLLYRVRHAEDVMEYKGIEYQLLRAIAKGWRWSFTVRGLTKNGDSHTRYLAIEHAERAIDTALKFVSNKKTASPN